MFAQQCCYADMVKCKLLMYEVLADYQLYCELITPNYLMDI